MQRRNVHEEWKNKEVEKKKHLRYNTVPSVAPSAVLNLTLPVDSDSKPVEHCISVSNEH